MTQPSSQSLSGLCIKVPSHQQSSLPLPLPQWLVGEPGPPSSLGSSSAAKVYSLTDLTTFS